MADPPGPRAVHYRQHLSSPDEAVKGLAEAIEAFDGIAGDGKSAGVLTESEAAAAVPLFESAAFLQRAKEDLDKHLQSSDGSGGTGLFSVSLELWKQKFANATAILSAIPPDQREGLREIVTYAEGQGYHRPPQYLPNDAKWIRVEGDRLRLTLVKGGNKPLEVFVPVSGNLAQAFRTSFDAAVKARETIPGDVINRVMVRDHGTWKAAIDRAIGDVTLPPRPEGKDFYVITLRFTINSEGKIPSRAGAVTAEIDWPFPEGQHEDVKTALGQAAGLLSTLVRNVQFPAGFAPTPTAYPFHIEQQE